MAKILDKKLRLAITLVHGTWARDARWTRAGGRTREYLEQVITKGWGADVEIVWSAVDWSGLNRLKHRVEGGHRLLNHMLSFVRRYPGHAHYIVAHSHGGSVAMEALQDAEVGLPTRLFGVVCMNTPFAEALPRTASHTLPGLLGVMFAVVMAFAAVSLAFVAPTLVLTAVLAVALLFGVVLLALRLGPSRWRLPLYRQYVQHYKLFHDSYFGRHLNEPPVLCVWTADDEATMGLQGLETLVNLPRLIIHPYVIMVLLVMLIVARSLSADGWLTEGLRGIIVSNYLVAIVDVLVALTGATFGVLALAAVASIVRTIALGTWVRDWWLMDLFARFTVSLVPLRHSDTEFRPVEDLVPRGLTLRHSRVYTDELALDVIASWILKTFHRREPIIFRRMVAHIVDALFFDFDSMDQDEFAARLLQKIPGSDRGLVEEVLNQLKAVEFLTVETSGDRTWVSIHREEHIRARL